MKTSERAKMHKAGLFMMLTMLSILPRSFDQVPTALVQIIGMGFKPVDPERHERSDHPDRCFYWRCFGDTSSCIKILFDKVGLQRFRNGPGSSNPQRAIIQIML